MSVIAGLAEDRIFLESEWATKERIQLIPGSRWDGEARVWKIPLTWTSCLQLRGLFRDELTLSPHLREWAREYKEKFVTPAGRRVRLLVEEEGCTLLFQEELRRFQRAGVHFLDTVQHGLLGDEMGTGKTLQALESLRLHGSALPALVVCPSSVTGSWRREIERWWPEAVPYVMGRTAVQRRKTLASAAKDPNAVVISGYEAARIHSSHAGYGSIALKRCASCGGGSASVKEASCEAHPRELNEFGFRAVVVDEAHRLKDPKAKQTRAMWSLGQGKTVVKRLALTGTPIANHVGDLWSILRFLRPEEFPTKSRFIDRYALAGFNRFGGLEITGVNPENQRELYAILDTLYRAVPKKAVLTELPEKVYSTIPVELDAKQMKAYQELHEKLYTRLDDGTLMMPKADISAYGRLTQLASAYLTQVDGTVEMCEPSPKLDVLEDILADRPGQLAVCAHNVGMIKLAAKRLDKLGITYGMIIGEIPQWEREANLAAFQRGELRVMLFTIQAGGIGLTMTAADTIVFLQRSGSLVDNLQAEDRVHRIGSERHDSIHVIDIVASGTVEDTRLESLRGKKERMEEIRRFDAKDLQL